MSVAARTKEAMLPGRVVKKMRQLIRDNGGGDGPDGPPPEKDNGPPQEPVV